MGIRRACSWQATVRTPTEPSNYSSILVAINQRGRNVIVKTKPDLSISTDGLNIILNLSQTETAQLISGINTYMQVRCYKSEYEAPGSQCWPIEVLPALDDRILP